MNQRNERCNNNNNNNIEYINNKATLQQRLRRQSKDNDSAAPWCFIAQRNPRDTRCFSSHGRRAAHVSKLRWAEKRYRRVSSADQRRLFFLRRIVGRSPTFLCAFVTCPEGCKMVRLSRRLRPPASSQALIFSGAPNLCARFKQSLALRNILAERLSLWALPLPMDWSSCHRSLWAPFAQWAEERHCLRYSSGWNFVFSCWQAAWARQRRGGGSLSACACSSASESLVASFLGRYGPPSTNLCLSLVFLLPSPGRGLWRRSTSGDVHQRVRRARR